MLVHLNNIAFRGNELSLKYKNNGGFTNAMGEKYIMFKSYPFFPVFILVLPLFSTISCPIFSPTPKVPSPNAPSPNVPFPSVPFPDLRSLYYTALLLVGSSQMLKAERPQEVGPRTLYSWWQFRTIEVFRRPRRIIWKTERWNYNITYVNLCNTYMYIFNL